MNYAKNFDLQWNTFRQTQLDSHTGSRSNENRLYGCTKWTKEELKGSKVLEAGCGPGKYTEIILKSGASVTAFDLTTAVYVNYEQNSCKGDLSCFQGDIYNLPDIGEFDYVFCYGVLQHCPDPVLAYKKLFEKLKPGGKISVDYYTNPRTPSPWTTPKYFWRRWSIKIKPESLLRIIRLYMPIWLPIDTVIRFIPKVGPLALGIIRIPCWNYLDVLKDGLRNKKISEAIYEWYQWAVMDTFDALGAAYDYPKTLEEVREMVDIEGSSSIDVFYGGNGIVANVVKLK